MRKLSVCIACATLLSIMSGTASAQYGVTPAASSVAGEDYHVEFTYGLWTPQRDIIVSSESLGIIGTSINAVTDLGFERETFQNIFVVLRPTEKFKFRFGFTPIKYQGEHILTRTIVFNGQRYDIGLPVQSELDWKLWRFGLEYDVFYRSRGFVGFLVDVNYTDIDVMLTSPITSEFTHVKVPIPAIGGIGRFYIGKNFAVTGELSGLKLTIDEDTGQFVNFDLNGTYNFTNNFGVQGGYRSLNVEYGIDQDSGNLELNGLYFGGVARF